MNKILITGGAGYIGSHAVLKAIEDGFEVAVLDSFERSDMENLNAIEKLVDKKIKIYKADLKNENETKSAIQDFSPDFVMHFAAYKSVPEGQEKPELYRQNNIGGSKNLFQICENLGVKKVVFSSTAAVYGDKNPLPITEKSETNPINVYGETKLEAEKILQNLCQKNPNFTGVALRYFNVIGTHKSGVIGEAPGKGTNFLPLILANIFQRRENVTLFGNNYPTKDGTQERDYIDVNDLINAHFQALKNLNSGFHIFNLSTKKPTSCQELIQICEKVADKKVNVLIGEHRAGDPNTLYADNEKAKKDLNWESTKSVQESVQSQYDYTKKFLNK